MAYGELRGAGGGLQLACKGWPPHCRCVHVRLFLGRRSQQQWESWRSGCMHALPQRRMVAGHDTGYPDLCTSLIVLHSSMSGTGYVPVPGYKCTGMHIGTKLTSKMQNLCISKYPVLTCLGTWYTYVPVSFFYLYIVSPPQLRVPVPSTIVPGYRVWISELCPARKSASLCICGRTRFSSMSGTFL